MCGIAGIVAFDDALQPRRKRALAMGHALRHRGPDGEGSFVEGPVALAHTRLALVDRQGGAQPMRSPDGRFVLVYNGEVYNGEALRAELAWTPRTRSDAEVVLAAWATWGEACLPRLNGMFAFFVWDTRTHTGWLARDLMGVKPVVYSTEGGFAFASEAKALIAGQPRRAHRDAILEYLVAPAFSGVATSMFEGIEHLPPGHVLRIDRSGVVVRAWGRFSPSPRDVHPEELRDALERATHRCMAADVPVGLFLSGGLDSSLLASFAQRSSPPAFTIAFEDQERFEYERSLIVTSDDAPFARELANELDLEHHIVAVRRSTLPHDLATLARHNDALPAWEQELAQHHLARAASSYVKAVLVGDAADETHFGYHFLLDARATSTPARILERFCDPILRRDVLADPIAHFDAEYRARAREAGYDWDDDGLAATSWLVRTRWLPRLLHNGDLHCMAHGVEARVPFADSDVLALAMRIGPELALRDGVEKAFLREAMRGVVSERIRTRRKSALPKDQGVAAIYQREALRAIEEAGDLLRGVLDVDRLRVLCERPIDERERAMLFRAICLAHWARAYEVQP